MEPMKKTVLVCVALIVFGILSIHAQTQPNPSWLFSCQGKDTVMGREQIHHWGKSGHFPDYLKWKNTPLAICPSLIHGVGLFCDSTSKFSAGQDVGMAFIKVSGTGLFIGDYLETNIGMFVNNSQNPNVEIVMAPQGLIMRALVDIGPNIEITASYQSLIDLFPDDGSAALFIKYW